MKSAQWSGSLFVEVLWPGAEGRNSWEGKQGDFRGVS